MIVEVAKSKMYKAALIVSIPEKMLKEHPLNEIIVAYGLKHNGWTFIQDFHKQMKGRLKLLPEKKPVNFMNYWFVQGYNACLEEIIGEEEE